MVLRLHGPPGGPHQPQVQQAVPELGALVGQVGECEGGVVPGPVGEVGLCGGREEGDEAGEEGGGAGEGAAARGAGGGEGVDEVRDLVLRGVGGGRLE